MSFFSTLFKAGKTAVKANPIGLAVGALPSFFGAFNSDRYKSDYHYKTQYLKENKDAIIAQEIQNQQLKIEQQKKQEMIEKIKQHAVKIIGAVAVIGLAVFWFKRSKTNKR